MLVLGNQVGWKFLILKTKIAEIYSKNLYRLDRLLANPSLFKGQDAE